MTDARRFTGRQITAMVAMLSAAIVLAPVGAVAASNAFSIADPVHPAYKAHVTKKGSLVVTAQDGTSGVRARVDKTGHAIVGDGSGPLTVDGSVKISGNVRGYAPSATWYFTNAASSGPYFDLTSPRADAVNLTSLFASGDSTTQLLYLGIYAATVPSSATGGCKNSATSLKVLWQGEAGGAPGQKDPIAITFPTPLTARPASGKKTCLVAYLNHGDGSGMLSASGYYGG